LVACAAYKAIIYLYYLIIMNISIGHSMTTIMVAIAFVVVYGQSTTTAPTKSPIFFTPKKCNSDFNCTKKIFCGQPNAIPPKPFLKNCACDKDIYGKPVCWQNMRCKDLFKRPCNALNKCKKKGLRCVPLAGTCCEKLYEGPLKRPSFCVRPCFSKGFPYTPPIAGVQCPIPSALGLC
jgi:hypothetical protein